MPHQCTQCGHTFPDGSKEMLSGCPDCGGNKFQFRPTDDARESRAANSSSATPPATGSTPEPTPNDPPPNDPSPDDGATAEDPARADARHDVASGEELAAGSNEAESGSFGPPEPGPPESERSEPRTAASMEESEGESDMDALRRRLNDQFESIKILEPGQYELNLMELYNREEYIIALQEDGQYVIEVPETWLGNE